MSDIYCTASASIFCRKMPMSERCRNCPTKADQNVIDSIFEIRVANNVPWKKLMEIALKHAPEETKAVLREINANDRKVSDLLGELAK